MSLAIDHVLVCVPDLDAAAVEYEERLGLSSVEGGRHSGHGTANRVIPLGDSYIELIAVVSPREAKTSALGTWAMHRAAVPGADALCLRTSDISTVAAERDIQVSPMSRVRPDGMVLSWKLAGLKSALQAGLPFFIQWEIPEDLHPGLAPVEHATGPQMLESVTLFGDVDTLERWVGAVSRLSVASGEPGIDFDLAARA